MTKTMTPFLSGMTMFAIATVSAAVLTGCAKQGSENATAPPSAQSMRDDESTSNQESMQDMPMPEANPSSPAAPSEMQTHAAKGTIQSIDHEAGTVKIAHETVPSMNWPAMTMEFKASSAQELVGLAEGEQVEFHFTAESAGRYTITEISPQR